MEELIKNAKNAMKNAYSPYSNYEVGCALKTKTGKIYTGCNIENDGIMSICAERVAFVKAISEGEKEFECMLILGKIKGNNNFQLTMPCGYCRQFINEFVDDKFKIYIFYNENEKIQEYKINDLLPYNFKL